MKQNGWEENLGTKLEETVGLSLSYDLIQAEILSTYAETHLSNYVAFCVMQNKVMKPSDSSVCALADILSSLVRLLRAAGRI